MEKSAGEKRAPETLKGEIQIRKDTALFYRDPGQPDSSSIMILSDNEIRKAARNKQLAIIPYRHVNPAGIDLRIDRTTTIKPHQHQLAATIERVELSNKLAGILHIRSSLAREGVFASLALVDPGYRGQLTVSLYNAGARPVKLKHG